jgi:tetratricopeptide (TPR) repeat protein
MPTEMDSEGRELVTLSELEDTALVLSAYAGLCLGDPAAALTRARTVLLREDGSARLRFLARCYASEAELALGQVDVDLSFYLAHDGSMLSQTSKLVNYGAMQVAQADLTGALATYLQAYSISPNDTNVIKGVAYVYLRLGKIKEALLIANYNQPITPIT